MQTWRMFLALEPDEVGEIRDAVPMFLPPERYGVITEILPDGSDGASQLALDVAAQTEEQAVEEAQNLYERVRQAANLEAVPATVLGYNVPTDVGPPLHDQLYATAGLRETMGHYEDAVVTAQASCEVLAAEVLEQLMVSRGLESLQLVYKGRPVTLRDGATQPLFNTLTSTRIQDEKWWPRYDAHVLRRNDVVHRGLSVNKEGARASLEAAAAFRASVASFRPPSS